MRFVQLVIDHYDTIAMFVTLVCTILKLSKWGKANSVALDAVIAVIEAKGGQGVKDGVRDLELRKDVRKAIERKVEKHQG